MSIHQSFFFFFNDTSTTEIYTLSLHDALPIFWNAMPSMIPVISAILPELWLMPFIVSTTRPTTSLPFFAIRSEEHTSELQSQFHLVCRLLLEKKKKK